MTKYKCCQCGACFDESEAEIKKDRVDYFEGFGNLYQSYIVCPECGADEPDELQLDSECTEYDEEFGCTGDCENCPLQKDLEEEE